MPDRVTTGERIAGDLRRRIAAGVYAPGTFLPGERQLAEELGTSRRSLSAAIRLLTSEGLLASEVGRGTVVRPVSQMLHNRAAGIVHDVYTPSTLPESMRLLLSMQHRFEELRYAFTVQGKPCLPYTADDLLAWAGAVVFLETGRLSDLILELEHRRVPLVVANLEIEMAVSATRVDHHDVMRQAVKLLHDMGHTTLGFIGGPVDRLFYGKACRGFIDGLKSLGMPVHEDLICTVEGPHSLAGYLSGKRLMEMAESRRPTAIVAARDVYAEAAARAVEEHGLTVGRDVSIIGYDDLSGTHPDPFLTTFREPCEELGTIAVDMLIDRIIHGWRPPEQRVLPTPLVLRRSVGPRVAPVRPILPPLTSSRD